MIPSEVREAWGRPDFRPAAMTDEVRALAEDSMALDRGTPSGWRTRTGVPMLASTGASFANPCLFRGFSLLDERDLYVRIGLTPQEALYTATVAPPRFFGLTDQDGAFAPGRRADWASLQRRAVFLRLATAALSRDRCALVPSIGPPAATQHKP